MKKLMITRKIVQIVSFFASVVLMVLLYRETLDIVHRFCPFSIVCFGTIGISQKIIYFPITMIFAGLITLSALWFGRWFCGYLCFLGTLQEWLYRLVQPKKRKVNRISSSEEKKLGYAKYLVLIACIILAFFGLAYIYMRFCPIMVLRWLDNLTWMGILILAVIFIAGCFVERFWCRFLCPYAALLNIVQAIGDRLKIRAFRIHRNMETCIDCYLCCKTCPKNLNLLEDEILRDPNCIKCYRCVSRCVKKGTLTIKRIQK